MNMFGIADDIKLFEKIILKNPDEDIDLEKYNSARSVYEVYKNKKTQLAFRMFCIGRQYLDSEKE